MKDNYDNELDNYDLISEMEHIGEMHAQVNALLIDTRDYNHCLLEDEVDELEESIEKAVDKFKSALMKRRMRIIKVLKYRGVFKDDDSYTVVVDDDSRIRYGIQM